MVQKYLFPNDAVSQDVERDGWSFDRDDPVGEPMPLYLRQVGHEPLLNA